MNKRVLLRIQVLGVLVCGESCQSLLVDIDFQRVEASDCDIDSQVELQPVDQKRVGNVLADYDAVLLLG